MSTNKLGIKAVDELAKAYDIKLRSDDPRFRNGVMVIHEEGTVLYFEWAFAIKLQNWYVIFTEHHRWHVYDEDDVKVFMRGPRVKIPILENMNAQETLRPQGNHD
jgi:hypothetical protein